jgi:glucan phosphoethanolaminetransferase (alkaline phosphatase superfamily)
LLEVIGPLGIVRSLKELTKKVSNLQSGLIYHYALIMVFAFVFFILLLLLPFYFKGSLLIIYLYLFIYTSIQKQNGKNNEKKI